MPKAEGWGWRYAESGGWAAMHGARQLDLGDGSEEPETRDLSFFKQNRTITSWQSILSISPPTESTSENSWLRTIGKAKLVRS